MTTPTPDGRWPGPPAGHGRPGQPYPRPGYRQAAPGGPGYVPPGYSPPGYGEPYEDPAGGGRVLRSVLVLAAVAGVITVLIGLIFMVSSPEEYGLADQRTALPPRAQQQNTAAPADPYFQAPANVPPPQPTLPAAPAMQPSTPVRLVIPRLGVNAPIKSVGLDRQGAIEVPPVNNANLAGWYREGPTPGRRGRRSCWDTRTRGRGARCSAASTRSATVTSSRCTGRTG
nr:hypothetical protein GCM10020093_086980 [Planobispora longispora]